MEVGVKTIRISENASEQQQGHRQQQGCQQHKMRIGCKDQLNFKFKCYLRIT
jgi:hypothetical protein